MSLDLTSKSFSLANARELALYARMAYDEPPTIQDERTDTQVLIRDRGDCVIVSSKGTSDLRDFVTDARAWRTETLLGGIHTGFYEAASSIRTQLLAALEPLRPKPILFDGHSLGGSLAILNAKAARDAFHNVHSVYTFGCPRVGDKKFQSLYNASSLAKSPFDTLGAATFTVINDCDIVPRVPGWLAGYRRPGRDEFISELQPEKIVEDPSFFYRLESDAVSLLQGWWAKRSPVFLTELLLDHHIDQYIQALELVEPKADETSALPVEAA